MHEWFLQDKRNVRQSICLCNGLPLDEDVYDAALWSCIAPLSEKSVANRSQTMDIPDFTKGNWKTNKPVNLTLDGGGNTTIRSVKEEGSNQLNLQ